MTKKSLTAANSPEMNKLQNGLLYEESSSSKGSSMDDKDD